MGMEMEMCARNISLALILLTSFLFFKDSTVSAVNSPQMTFYTPDHRETFVHLQSKYGYSATLKLTRPKPFVSSSPFQINSTIMSNVIPPKKRKVSEFVVLGPEYPLYGVTAIIQAMNLRTNNENGGCRDFVQFAPNASESFRTKPICGRMERNEDMSNNTDPRRRRSFFSPEGTVHIYFSSDPSIAQDEVEELEEGSNKDIAIEIVFTSYTICPNPANSWKKLKPCSKTEKMSCVYSTLFCDNKIDCDFPGEYGVDEEGCYFPYIYMTLSIVGGILLTVTVIYLFVRWVTKVPKRYR